MTLKEQLIYVRTKLQLTHAELAEKTGIAQITIARWETVEKIKPQVKAYGKFLAFCEENGIKFN